MGSMSLIQRFTRMFSRAGRDEAALHRGVQLAQSKKPEAALKIYNELITSPATDAELRAQAMFNRALAYSMLKKDSLAVKDLTEVLAMPRLSENVRDAARSQLTRVNKRAERDHK